MAGSVAEILERLGMADDSRGELASINPATGASIGRVRKADASDYESTVARSAAAFEKWRMRPAPVRGRVVADIGAELRRLKDDLGALVTLESGKILAEGKGEVQEMIDIADFAVGLSRQLYGLTMPSERPGHRLYEQWHPLGPVGVITAFNFPVAVWSWNALIAAVCGDTVIWKPSPLTPLTAVAVQKICERVMAAHECPWVFETLIGDVEVVGEPMLSDRRLPLISATGSCRMGRHVAQKVAARLGRTLLELGGNNAVIVMGDADLDLALRAILFGAVGTAGQRCTSIRRLLVQKAVAAKMVELLRGAYRQVRIGDPMDPASLMGPLITEKVVEEMMDALDKIRAQGGELVCGGKRLHGNFVEPTIVRSPPGMPMMQEEVFAPLLHVVEFETLDEAIALNNGVPQGLSSAIFTKDLRNSEAFLSARGSDCGIANVNIGTSGAEIGGAFGGEKETGGGRESGSDAWKAYMRRQTVTINYSTDLPLAQGIEFKV
ncbi:MAG: aldehyde dehydrogenase family protein [Acidimicrobiia bacterium]|nr:aldehyde dehydrogenase family protein [Acidimicrobiia bacterium]